MAGHEPELLTPGTASANPTYDQLKAELERLRERQRQLEEEQQRLKSGSDGAPRNQKQPDQPGTPGQPAEEQKKEEQREEPKKPPLRQRFVTYAHEHPARLLAGIVILAALLVAGYFVWRYIESYESTDDAEISGHIDAISPRIPGTVIGVYIENNQHVAQGQVLVDLDPTDYRVGVERAQANLSQAEARVAAANPNVQITATTSNTAISTARADVAAMQAGVTAAQQEYQSALAAVRQAQADNEKAQQDVARYRMLVQKDEIPRQVYDTAVAAGKASAAAVTSANARAEAALKVVAQRQAQLGEARSRLREASRNAPSEVAIRRADIRTWQANVQAAKAALDQALLNLGYCQIVAPVEGLIGEKTVEVGEHVQAGQELFAIVPLNDIWVTADFKETQIRNMRPGQSVTIHVDALDQDYDGYVESLPGATGARFSLLPPENATGNYVKVVQRLPVRIRFKPGQDLEHRLVPGMSVEPKVWVK
jgi:membrane fusion protein (multidrug efflux system)